MLTPHQPPPTHPPLDQVFAKLQTLFYSQFNIMCAYLYHYQRDDYVWYLHDRHPQEWNTSIDGVVARSSGSTNPGQVTHLSVCVICTPTNYIICAH